MPAILQAWIDLYVAEKDARKADELVSAVRAESGFDRPKATLLEADWLAFSSRYRDADAAVALIGEVLRFVPGALQGSFLLGIAAVSVAIWTLLAQRLRWASLGMLCTLLMPAAGAVLLVSAHDYYHPAAQFGWLAWLAVFGVHFISLRRLATVAGARVLSVAHVLGCWMLIGVLALELRYGLLLLSSEYNAWRWLGWAILPSLYLVLAAAPRAWPWPVSAYPREYRVLAVLPLAVLMLGWFWLANSFSDGTATPLPYVPLLSPLDLGRLFALLGVYLWSRSVAQSKTGVPLSQPKLRPSLNDLPNSAA